MSFYKRGESFEIRSFDIQNPDSVVPMVDDNIREEMKNYIDNIKTASGGKKIAPKANDFLYFAAVMMHAAEAVLVNDDGSPKLTRNGKNVEAHWDTSNNTWRWVCNDPSIKPFKNANGDIFSEAELIKAHKKWVGKPLCIDHKSSSVDHVRGFIVDTYYDRNLKRVIGLCALDKINYPDLARKIETGYSNSVSMGTAVERAVCYDCGTVARNEHDFCNHMKTKSGYGEINIGLSPMELSIVVNGADPKARIKHVIAMANSLNSYVEEKSLQLQKIAAESFSAQLNMNDNVSSTDTSSIQMNVGASNLEEFRKNVTDAIDNYQKLQISGNNQESNYADNQSSGTKAMEETELSSTDYSDAPPHARFASKEEDKGLEEELASIKLSIEAKLNKMQEDLNKLSSLNKEEKTMSGNKDNMNKQGYFQGAGGDNEPTPGSKKYSVDPMQDDLRDTEDRQMVGQKPFPGVGPVDGLHPGHNSSPTSELERKKMLARATAEERALRRSAAINKAKDAIEASKKEAYMQNGEDASNPNTPTPGKQKYKPDPMQDKLRDKEDKQMVGQKPFPGVGDVEKMHPSPDSADQKDEQKRKEMLSRASRYHAKFVTASDDNGLDRANSAWEVYKGEDLVLSKTVDELTDGKSDTLFSGIATEAFGKDLVNKIKNVGLKAVDNMFKKAQMQNAPALPQGLPANDLSEDEVKDTGGEADPKQTVVELSEKVRDLSSDLVEAVHTLTGDQAEMGEVGEEPLPLAAADDGQVSLAALNALKKNINAPLALALKEASDKLDVREDELNSIVGLYDKGAMKGTNDAMSIIVNEAIEEAKQAYADSLQLLGSYIKFARANHLIEKRAEKEKLTKSAHGDNMGLENKEIMDMLGETGAELDDLDSELAPDTLRDEETDLDLEGFLSDDLLSLEEDENDALLTSDPVKAVEMAKKDPSVDVELKTASTKEARQALRAKFAAEVKWSPMLNEFHKHVEDPKFDVRPSGNLGHVETIDEVHDAMMDLATSGPNVRKTAEDIQKFVVSGELEADQVDLLVAAGVDAAAVKYWKDLYGEAGPEGKAFATELVKTHSKAHVEQEQAVYRVKVARAYEMAHEMASRGLIPSDRNAISAQADEVMSWNDEGFESMKKVIAKHEPLLQKAAGHLPQVGIYGGNNVQHSEARNDFELFAEIFSTRKPSSRF